MLLGALGCFCSSDAFQAVRLSHSAAALPLFMAGYKREASRERTAWGIELTLVPIPP